MNCFTAVVRPSLLLLAVAFTVLPLTGCGPSGNTVVEPGDGTMNDQEMEDYNKEMSKQDSSKYEDRYK